jgi:hypothetical protein
VKKRILALFAVFLGLPLACFAMTSTNYLINWDSVNVGGADTSTSTNYLLRDTIGEHATGISTSTNYRISAGYRVAGAAEPYLAFHIGTQQNDAVTSWTAFSLSGKTVVVTTSTLFATGDYIAVVENQGFAQLVAVGKVASVVGSTVTVDAWAGEPGSLSAVPSGADDYAYRLNGSAADLGMQSIVTENTSITETDVVSNASNGYTVTVQGLDYFRSGANIMQSVSDGAVTVGSEEYGIEAVGSLATGAGADVAIPVVTPLTVQQSSSAGSNDRIAVVYKLAVSPSTPTGNYTQTVLYRLTGNF